MAGNPYAATAHTEAIAVPLWQEPEEIYADLAMRADGEGLLHIGPPTRACPAELAPLVEHGLVFLYVGRHPRARFAYLPRLAPRSRPSSDLPPPSLQNGGIVKMYAARDNWTCHLCGLPIYTGWNLRPWWPSPDHLIPRARGGTDYPSNIKASHFHCNIARGDRSVHEARYKLRGRGPAERFGLPKVG